IQILLKTMLDTKLKRHDLYEIQRIEEFYDKAKERMDYANLIHQLRVAGTNASLLTPLLVNYPQKFNKDLVDETERTDAYVEFFLTIQCLFFVLSLILFCLLVYPYLSPLFKSIEPSIVNAPPLRVNILIDKKKKKKKKKENWTPLHVVCRYQTRDNIRVFCEFLPPPQRTYWSHLTDEEGFRKTPLMIGCENANKGKRERGGGGEKMYVFKQRISLHIKYVHYKLFLFCFWTCLVRQQCVCRCVVFQEDISPLFKHMPSALLEDAEFWKETREGEDCSNVLHLVLANDEQPVAVRAEKLRTILRHMPEDLAAFFVEQQNKEAVSPATMCKMMDSLRKNIDATQIEMMLGAIIQKKRDTEAARRRLEEAKKVEEEKRLKARREQEEQELRESKRVEYMREILEVMALGFEDMDEILTKLIKHNGNVDATAAELFQIHFG
ncbi:hypothetical protein RFI_15170, partial [Reticulomyxa filosa]